MNILHGSQYKWMAVLFVFILGLNMYKYVGMYAKRLKLIEAADVMRPILGKASFVKYDILNADLGGI